MSNGQSGVGALKFLKALVWIVYAIAVAASIIIAFGFFLLMFDASTEAGFAAFIYSWGLRFAGPFVGMIEPTKLANGGVIAWSALFAIIAYLVLAWIIGSILDAISRGIYNRSRPAQVVVAPVAAQQPVAAQPQPAAPQPAAPQPAAAEPTAPAAEPPAPAAEPDANATPNAAPEPAAEAPAAETPPPAGSGE